ncbi:chaperonin 10-like protein [Ilyonectria robusta]|uniref:chaperonin 10-like protein n=1 Tax=Ilyonectria robusta TaxID=1079257 RepID=UPI001E8CBC13|nr:chaperonin 10-like protein [Ilyonectria robusta]KAH8650493.1 chaperonin 10-like protein [Ilyonectria robusta]
MKSFRLGFPDTPFQLQNIPIPEPGQSQALIAVKAAGLCHTDAHYVEGHGIEMLPSLPLTLGHEVAGTVVKLGSEPCPVQVGDRVAVALVAHPVEKATRATTIGLGYDGGYSEFALAHYEHLVKIPDGVTFAQAAVATDSISTAYHATVVTGGVTKSAKVAVIGIGGLGLNAVAISVLQGAKVYGIDLNEAKYDDAKRLGAVACSSRLDSFAGVVFDVVLDFVGSTSTISAALSSVRKGGTIVMVGLDGKNVEVSSVMLVTKSVSVKGSFGSSKEELVEVLNLIASRKITPKLTEIPFEDVPKGLEAIKKNKVEGRLFVQPNAD